MLSIFPELYNYSHIAPFLLRLAVGVFFIISGFRGFFIAASGEIQTKEGLIIPKIMGILELVSGALLLVGLFVQPTAIAVSIMLIAAVIFKTKPGFSGIYDRHEFRFILLAVLLSLIVSSPGIFSIDLPL